MTRRKVKVDLGFHPRPHQRDAHEKRERFTVLVWHRRAGKTVFSIVELLLAALSVKTERARFAYMAPYLKQAKQVAWDYLKHYAAKIPGSSINESELAVDLPNGARIRIYGADNPDALRGIYLDGVVMDEVADMKPQVWGEIIRPTLTDRRGWAIFIGTPKGPNLFSELYYKALSHDEPGWHADLRRAEETGALSHEELQSAKSSMSPPQYAQEYGCDFAAAVENALIPLDAVRNAMSRDVPESTYFFAPKVLGIDVARTGGDRVVIFPRQGITAFAPKAFRPSSLIGEAALMEVAGQAARAIDAFQPHATFIDQTGLGAGVVDRLRQLGYRVIGVDFGSRALNERYENRRAEMWDLMAKWVMDGGCLPNIPELVTELTAPTYSYANSRGRFELESKDEIKERIKVSPDLADAIALTFAAPVAQPDATTFLPGIQQKVDRCLTDYDPFEQRGA